MNSLKNLFLSRVDKWDGLFLVILAASILLQGFLSAGSPVREEANANVKPPTFELQEIAVPYKPEYDVKFQTTLSFLFLLVFCIGLCINFLAVIFLFIDKQAVKNFFSSTSHRLKKSSFQIRDIFFFLIFGHFVMQLSRAALYIVQEVLTTNLRIVMFIKFFVGTLGIQLATFVFLILYSRSRYNQLPDYFKMPDRHFIKKFAASFTIFFGLFPWIFLLTSFGLYLSSKLNIAIEPHIVTKIISKNALSLSSIYLMLYAVIGAPFFEEFIFRGFMYGAIKKRYGMTIAVIITSLIFSLFHMNFQQFFYIFGLGIALVLVFEATNNLWFPVILHAANNIIAVGITLLLRHYQ